MMENGIMNKFIIFSFLIVLCTLMSGCRHISETTNRENLSFFTKTAPKCDSEISLETVQNYVANKYYKNDKPDLSISVSLPQTLSYDKDIDKYVCRMNINFIYPQDKYGHEDELLNKICYIKAQHCLIDFSTEISQNKNLFSYSGLYNCIKEYGNCYKLKTNADNMLDAYNNF